MQLLWTIVTFFGMFFEYLQKNIEHGIEHDFFIVLMEFAYIRHSLNLADITVDSMNLTVC